MDLPSVFSGIVDIGSGFVSFLITFITQWGVIGLAVIGVASMLVYVWSSGFAEWTDRMLKVLAIILFIVFLVAALIAIGYKIDLYTMYSNFLEGVWKFISGIGR